MANLFIIGNGFDIAHELPTSYEDFRKYLILSYAPGYHKQMRMPQPLDRNIYPDGAEFVNKKDLITFILELYDIMCENKNTWGDLEEQTGNIPYEEWLNKSDLRADDENGGIKESWTRDNFEIMAKNIRFAIPLVAGLIEEWISTINVTKAHSDQFQQLVNVDKDLFLSFNYTLTLEKIYQISPNNICHIHGKCHQGYSRPISSIYIFDHDVQRCNSAIKFGHNKQYDIDEEHDFAYYGIREIIEDTVNALNKQVSQNITQNKWFFDRLKDSDIRHVYSYGFSYSETDENYIKEIIKCIDNPNITWHFDDYDNDKNLEYQKKIRQYGYTGRFALQSFTI